MVEITLLEVDLQDAEFNAPFADSGGGVPVRRLKRAVSGVTRSSESGSSGDADGGRVGGTDGGSSGSGVAMIGALVVLVALGWLMRRARRRASFDELPA